MIRENRLAFIEQNDERSTHAPKLTKQEAQIDWSKSAKDIHNHIRGFSPNPGATAQLQINGKDPIQVRIEKGFVAERIGVNTDVNTGFNEEEFYTQVSINKSEIPTGTIIGIYKSYIIVKTGKGHYGISQIRLAGKAPMDAIAFNNGYFKNNTQVHFLPKEI